MLKARNKKLSMILVLAMLMTMFAGLGVASAAGTEYTVLKAPVVSPDETSTSLGTIKVTIPEVKEANGSMFMLSLPTGIEVNGTVYEGGTGIDFNPNVGGTDNNLNGKANFTVSPAGKNTWDVKINVTSGTTGEGFFYIEFKDINVNHETGDISVDIIAPANSVFATKMDLKIGKSDSSGDTITSIKKANSITADGGVLENIAILETVPGTFESGKDIEARIVTKGFTWAKNSNIGNNYGAIVYGLGDWITGPGGFAVDKNDKTLQFNVTRTTSAETGRIALSGLTLEVDESVAELGDVEVKISGAGMTTTTIVVAKYVDYGVVATEGTSKEVIAGKTEQEIGTIIFEEGAKGSLIQKRTVLLTLPEGAYWDKSEGFGNANVKTLKGQNPFNDDWTVFGVDNHILKFVVKDNYNDKSKVEIKDLKVNLEPDFVGDLNVEVSGSAGITGTIKVADVKAPITAEATPVNVVIGMQNQKASEIMITETIDGAINDETAYTETVDGEQVRIPAKNIVTVKLADGFKFASKPDVTVEDGDIDIRNVKLITSDVAEDTLQFEVKASSAKEASKIKISNILLTGLRYAPEGKVVAEIAGSALVDPILETDRVAAKVTIANCITPAQGGGVVEFRVGSNIYYVGGVAKVMDVAPYIKGDRTYVPMRYLAEMLGAEVVWDDAARTVTLTKGDDVVVFTIGSTSYTVNGEAMTADVAPEIVNERTMLPARFVAEAFGAVVGWDAGTQTVLVQQ